MRIEVQPITSHTLGDLAGTAATSMFWLSEPGDATSAERSSDVKLDKELWMHHLLSTWGPCGFTAYVTSGDDPAAGVPAATIVFAPSYWLPGSKNFPTAPASPDAILISTVHVRDEFAGLFLENSLLQAVIDELTSRGVRAVEVFTRRVRDEDPEADLIAGTSYTTIPVDTPILWSDVVEQQGFHVVAEHDDFPRYRCELSDGHSMFGAAADASALGTPAAPTLGARWASA
ncbi:MAG: hypothetical protein Q4G37_02120 [Bifidobacterium sp.]|nr:hypothetical protein [Bifidobacterium sp.]